MFSMLTRGPTFLVSLLFSLLFSYSHEAERGGTQEYFVPVSLRQKVPKSNKILTDKLYSLMAGTKCYLLH